MKHKGQQNILNVHSVLNTLLYIVVLPNHGVPPVELMLPSFETAASGKNRRTGMVLLRPLQAMQGLSLVDKQFDESQLWLQADFLSARIVWAPQNL